MSAPSTLPGPAPLRVPAPRVPSPRRAAAQVGHDSWPVRLRPHRLAELDLPTPYLVCDLAEVQRRVRRFTAAMPRVHVHYAVKCNPSAALLRTVMTAGAGFEIASLGELQALQALGVHGADVLYSNTVKPADHVAGAYRSGVWRFAVDSEGEVDKIARVAPGSAVYARLRVDDGGSAFPLSYKFGTGAQHAHELLVRAREAGLQPYGLTFHVGSQSTSPAAWSEALVQAGFLMRRLAEDGITLEMLDIGGGFPARYAEPVPAIEEIGAVIERGLDVHLPYVPGLVVAEPGRYLAAEAGVMVATVLGRAERAGEHWLYTDVGAYNGLMESQQTGGRWPYPLWSSRLDHGTVQDIPFTVTGPSCDSSDTMFHGVPLPATMAEGDLLFIASAGAYTVSYASRFNGFPVPGTHFVGD